MSAASRLDQVRELVRCSPRWKHDATRERAAAACAKNCSYRARRCRARRRRRSSLRSSRQHVEETGRSPFCPVRRDDDADDRRAVRGRAAPSARSSVCLTLRLAGKIVARVTVRDAAIVLRISTRRSRRRSGSRRRSSCACAAVAPVRAHAVSALHSRARRSGSTVVQHVGVTGCPSFRQVDASRAQVAPGGTRCAWSAEADDRRSRGGEHALVADVVDRQRACASRTGGPSDKRHPDTRCDGCSAIVAVDRRAAAKPMLAGSRDAARVSKPKRMCSSTSDVYSSARA